MRTVFIMILAVGLLAGLNGVAGAAPAVTYINGTLTDGSSVTIRGTGFGGKAQAAPLKWDDFENGADGTTLTDWDLTGPYPPIYSGQVVRANSSMSGRANFINDAYSSSFGILGTPLPVIFFDVWYYYDAVPPYSRNHKLFRIHTNTYAPNLYFNIYCVDNTSAILTQDGINPCTGCVGGKWVSLAPEGSQYFERRWVHLQAYFEESSPGSGDGTAVYWIDGKKVVDERGTFHTRNSAGEFWDALWFGNYLGHEAPAEPGCAAYGDAWTYWDDVYVDTTQARVELGDGSTYDGSAHREIQLPTSWSDTDITITLNEGSFQNTNGLYLYVTDSNGEVNVNGFPLCPDCPAPPTEIQVQPVPE